MLDKEIEIEKLMETLINLEKKKIITLNDTIAVELKAESKKLRGSFKS